VTERLLPQPAVCRLIEPYGRPLHAHMIYTFGSPSVHWVKVTVDTWTRNVFTFEPMIVAGN
jgi:hypothetical protein